jgi:hypothetical protein
MIDKAGSIPVRHCGVDRRNSLTTLERFVVSLNSASWNQLERWFRDIDALRRAA